MAELLAYIIKSGIVISIFYGIYMLFLRKETFYSFNRVYLLITLLISFTIPFFHVGLKNSSSQINNNFEYVEHAFFEATQSLNFVEETAVQNAQSYPIVYVVLLLGMLVSSFKLVFQLVIIYKNVKSNVVKKKEKYIYVLMNELKAAHSFFNYIFIQKSDFNNHLKREILLHEQTHADKMHSLDLLIIGFLSVLQWFNPFMYLFKRALTETHEFQTDQVLLDKGADSTHYQQLLLDQVRSVVFAGVTSNFNKTLIKNRLKMMNKIKSSNNVILKYLLLFPIVFFIGIFFAISQGKIDQTINNSLSIIDGNTSFSFNKDDLKFDAQDSILINGDLWTLFGDASVRSHQYELNSDIIYINSADNYAYTLSDDYVPSISPIENKYLKRIPAGFGMRMHPILKVRRMHNGIDFSAATGTPVMATANGSVRKAEYNGPYGNYVIIDHGNGFSTAFMHMSETKVEEGETVSKGEVIGLVGNTGLSKAPHLHYEVMKDGEYVDPKDYLEKP